MKRSGRLKGFLGVLALMAIMCAISNAASAATLKTDKGDYAPGEVVIITGEGWKAGESVAILLHEEPQVDPDLTILIESDENGKILYAIRLPDTGDIGRKFTLTAVGQSSGMMAQMAFTDGNLRVQTNAAGITFDIGYWIFDGIGCAGGATGSGIKNDVGNINGTQFNKGVGNAESIRLGAEAYSDQGGVFIGWSSNDTNGTKVIPNPQTTEICVADFTDGGPHLYIANYSNAECGNGYTDLDEQCDDGNTASGDGCASNCTTELGWNCTDAHPSICAAPYAATVF